MKQILEGIRVLDFSTDPAGANTAARMSDFGADIIKIEAPDGDHCRKMGPFKEGVSLLNCWYNRGKRSVIIDLEDPKGIEIAKKLIKDADVIVESFMPGTMERLGLNYEEAVKIAPNVIYCSVTPFGQEGPYRNLKGNDLIVQALSGVMEITGDAEGLPQKHGIEISYEAGSMNAFGAIMAALSNREITGEGQYIDCATLQILVWLNSQVDRVNFGTYARREGNHHPTLSPFGLFYGKGGQSVIITALNPKLWDAICDCMGHPEYKEDERYSTLNARVTNRAQVVEIIEEWLRSFDDIQNALDMLNAVGVPSCQVYNVQDVLSDEHYTYPELRWFVQAETPTSLQEKGINTYLTHGPNAIFSNTPGQIRKAPDLGENSYEILEQCGLSRSEAEKLLTNWKEK